MSFQISALPERLFAHLVDQTDDVLRAHGARRMVVDACPGFPCRVSLEDAAVGENVLLLNYEHQAAATPYRSSHAIFVRERAVQAKPQPDEVPLQLRRRLLSVRAFDVDGMMIEAEVVEGAALVPVVERMFAREAVSYLHAHNAKPGCYAARIDRC
ncbi:MAG: DUF1203 domain-containing protein [Alphaproteobacteria bacterium]